MDADRTNEEDVGKGDIMDFDVDVMGPWCSCLPAFFSLGWATTVLAIVGFAVGALAYEANVQENWVNCYSDTELTEFDQSCYLKLMAFPGKLWIRALKCLIVPLMTTMMLILPEQVSNVGKVGVRLLCLLVFTSFVAAMEGLIWAWVFQPGNGVNLSLGEAGLAENNISEFESFLNIFELFIPSNIIDAMYNGDVLALIAIFLVFGIEIQKCPDVWKDPLLNVSKAILRATLLLLFHVMWFTPIAMFSLISYNLATMADLWDVFEALGRNPLMYFLSIKDAPITALITSSSAATMPVTLRVNHEAGNHKDLVKFCIPLGAGMNMDGTSLGFPIMVMFTAQMAEDFEVSSSAQFVVAILSMVCSMGAAPVPNAGLVFLTMLYTAADIPSEAQGLGYALIAAVDWLIDRVETAQNVTSDSFICGILSHYYGTNNGGCLSFLMKDLQQNTEMTENTVSM